MSKQQQVVNHLRKLEDDWGVIQRLEVEADTRTALVAAMTIAHVANSQVTHYAVRPTATEEAHSTMYLALCWHESAEGSVRLAYPLTTPKEWADFVEGWLKLRAEYLNEREPDTSGSLTRGFRVAAAHHYDVVRVEPRFIIYGK